MKKKIRRIRLPKEDEEPLEQERRLEAAIKESYFEESKIPVEFGFYWYCQKVLFFNNHFGSDGFDKEDVEKIASLVKKASDLSEKLCREQHFLINAEDNRFYVCINNMGYVFLPQTGVDEINRKIYGKTDDSGKIIGFRTIEDKYLNK